MWTELQILNANFNLQFRRKVAWTFAEYFLKTYCNMKKFGKCAIDITSQINSTSVRTTKRECSFNNSAALAEVSFDGTKESFQICLGNATSKGPFRDYGLSHIVPCVLNKLVEMFDRESLQEIAEVLIIHHNNLLLRITNQNCANPSADQQVLQIPVCGIVAALEREDSMSRLPRLQEVTEKDPGNTEISRLHSVVCAAFVGAVVGVLTYFALQKYQICV